MALLDDIKVFVRQTGTALDVQWRILADTALADMLDKGVDPAMLEADENGCYGAQVTAAVATYCQANGGFVDNNAASRLQQSYLSQVCHLLAHHNVLEAGESGES